MHFASCHGRTKGLESAVVPIYDQWTQWTVPGPSQTQPAKRGVGRPRGTFGGSEVRKRLRELKQGNDEPSTATGSAIVPKHKKSCVQSLDTPAGSMPDSHTKSIFSMMCSTGTPLQRKIFLYARQQASKPAEDDTLVGNGSGNPAKRFLFCGRRPVSTLRALVADADEGSRKALAKKAGIDQIRVAACVHEATSQLWSGFVQYIQHMLDREGYKRLLLIKSRRYDETPYKIRIGTGTASDPANNSSGTSSTAVVLATDGHQEVPEDRSKQEGVAAKVLQSELYVAALLHHEESKNSLLVSGKVPCPLQCVDRTTAENLLKCQLEHESQVPLNMLSKSFDFCVCLPCTDRAPKNIACEKGMSKLQEHFIKAHTYCTVHKASTCQKQTVSLIKGHQSGLLAVALCMMQAGSRNTLRRLLKEILKERLRIRIGEPQAVEYRNAVYDLWLGGKDMSSAVPCTSIKDNALKKSYVLRQRQRAILNHYCNGNIQENGVVVFMTKDYSVNLHERILQEYDTHVIPALLPHKCPYFNPSKFLGVEEALCWVGLLCAHHQLFVPLMQRFCGHKSKPQGLDDSTASKNWAGLLGRYAADGPLGQPDDIDWVEPDEHDEETARPEAQPKLDWHEQCKAKLKKALSWAMSHPGRAVFIMMICLKPLLQLMQSYMHLASDQWDHEQETAKANGKPRSFRVVELLQAKQITRFMEDLSKSCHFASPALPVGECTSAVRTCMFRMLMRAGAIVHQLLFVPHQNCPFRLFSALQDPTPVLETPPCMQDNLMKGFLQRFPSAEMIVSDVAQHVLATLAEFVQVDILRIEALHATSRRLINTRSLQTWSLAMSNMNAEWLIRQLVILRQKFTDSNDDRQGASKRVNKSAKMKKRKGHGASWNAFVSRHCQGQKLSGSLLKATSLKYKAAKAERNSEWEICRQMGEITTVARQMLVVTKWSSASRRSGTQTKSISDHTHDCPEDALALVPASSRTLDEQFQVIRCNQVSASRQRVEKEREESHAIAKMGQDQQKIIEAKHFTGEGSASFGSNGCFTFSHDSVRNLGNAKFAVPSDCIAKDRGWHWLFAASTITILYWIACHDWDWVYNLVFIFGSCGAISQNQKRIVNPYVCFAVIDCESGKWIETWNISNVRHDLKQTIYIHTLLHTTLHIPMPNPKYKSISNITIR